MRLSHDNLMTHFLGKVPYTSWLFTIYKKIPEILVGNFRSVKTVRAVHHLPKISGLSRRASTRLDSSYKMKLVRNSRNLMHQSIAATPSPPRLLRTIYPPYQSPGVWHLQILCCPGAEPTPGPFRSFSHARGFLSEYNYTEDFTGKESKLAPLSRTGTN